MKGSPVNLPSMTIRQCAIAGMFYPADPIQLTQQLESFFSLTVSNQDAQGIVSPHAGWIYSGQIAAHAFASIRDGFDGTFILIGPSHRGFSTCRSGVSWNTPIGPVQVDTILGDLIALPVDDRAMAYGNENSLEVQIPFIRYRFPGASIVPIMMGSQTLEEINRVGSLISRAIREYSGEVRIVASSDFSHYVSHDKARKDDLFAIEALTDLNVSEFITRIHGHAISACGYGPIGAMIESLRPCGVTRCALISYTTSGVTSGDYSQVVGYAALAVT
ncbi:MAG TPA: AmmeMemoRadiSam system protein B [Methanospirillum sp.]|nr:AmmeMemoRadiSam system protein B [Methanospirillum sp.]